MLGRVPQAKTPTKTLLNPNSRAVGSIAATRISVIREMSAVVAASTNAAVRTHRARVPFIVALQSLEQRRMSHQREDEMSRYMRSNTAEIDMQSLASHSTDQ